MKKIISLLLASFMLVSFAGCDAAGKSQSTTVTEEPVDTRPQMPNLVGLSLEQISMRYPKLKLDVTYEYDDEAKKDTVISQEIKAGERYNELFCRRALCDRQRRAYKTRRRCYGKA